MTSSPFWNFNPRNYDKFVEFCLFSYDCRQFWTIKLLLFNAQNKSKTQDLFLIPASYRNLRNSTTFRAFGKFHPAHRLSTNDLRFIRKLRCLRIFFCGRQKIDVNTFNSRYYMTSSPFWNFNPRNYEKFVEFHLVSHGCREFWTTK